MQVRTLKVKLSPTLDQRAALLAMMQRFNQACNWVSEVAFAQGAFRRIPLQSLCYHAIREQFGLPSQLAIHVTRKVGDSYAVEKSVCHTFDPDSAIIYDSRVLRLIGDSFVSLTLLEGREKISLDCGDYQRKHLQGSPQIGEV